MKYFTFKIKLIIALIGFLSLSINPIQAQDTDNDGVANAQDLDDDNDGILDVNETGGYQPSVTAGMAITDDGTTRTLTGGSVGGSGLSLSATRVNGATFETAIISSTIQYTNSIAYGIDPFPSSIANSFGQATTLNNSSTARMDYTVTFSVPMQKVRFYIRNIDFHQIQFVGTNHSETLIDGAPELELTAGRILRDIVPTTHSDPSRDGYGIVEISPTNGVNFTSISFRVIDNASSASTTDGWQFAMKGLLDLDTDTDGILNRLDLDSDNDGCLDVVESGGTDGNNDGVLDDGTNFTTTVDADGLVTNGTGGYNGVNGTEILATTASVSSAPADITLGNGDPGSFSVAATATETTAYTGTAPNTTPNYSAGSNADPGLNYQWYLGDPNNGGTALTNTGVYSGTTTPTLNISDSSGLYDNTYFVEVGHDDNSCIALIESAQLRADPCDAIASGNLDTDLDGISDTCDLDDDNDGILDVNETGGYQPSVTAGMAITDDGTTRTLTGGSVGGSGLSLSATRVNGATFGTAVFSNTFQYTNSIAYGIDPFPSSIANSFGQATTLNNSSTARMDYTVTFSVPMQKVRFYIRNIDFHQIQFVGTNHSETLIDGAPELELTAGRILRDIVPTTHSDPSRDGYGIVEISPTNGVNFTSISFRVIDNASSASTTDGWQFAMKGLLDLDTDGDGIPNRLDLDSDNDGCLDVVESGGTDGNNDGVLDDGTNFTTTVDADGLVTNGTGGYNGVNGTEILATTASVSSAPADITLGNGDPGSFSVAATATETTAYTGTAPNTTPNYSAGSNADPGLNYQWYLGDPNNGGTALTNTGVYSGTTTPTLNISDSSGLYDNTYFVEVGHDDNSCIALIESAQLRADPCDAIASGNLDTDLDGISDTCDLDDDNDGILDVNETGGYQPSVTAGMAITDDGTTRTLTGGSVGGSGLSLSATRVNGATFNTAIISSTIQYTNSIAYGIDPFPSSIANSFGQATTLNNSSTARMDYTVTFSVPMQKVRFYIRNIDFHQIQFVGTNHSETLIDGAPELELTAGRILRDIVPTTHSDPSRDGYGIVEISPTNGVNFTSISFRVIDNASSASTTDGWQFAMKGLLDLDTDGDGIPNRLDLDSDNDGIPDIVEAGGVDTNNDGEVDYPIVGDPTSMSDANGNGWSGVFDDGTADGLATEGGTPLADPNSDGDVNLPNRLDLDSDNDGIPDNIEGQTTQGYIAPSLTDTATDFETNRGFYTSYVGGFTPVDTDGDLTPDYLDGDSDNDGLTDLVESFTTTPIPANGVGTNGLSNDAEALDDYTDVNANAHNGTNFALLDTDGDMLADGSNANGLTTDFDYRDGGCFELNLRVFLEGSLIEESTGAFLGTTMRTSLNDGRFLPGQLSENLFFGNIYSTPGQPYNIAPWNYTGLQGAGFDSGNDPANADANYPATVVDWVLVSLRTSDTGSTLFQRAALLLENGDVEFVGEDACFQLEAAQSYFVVVEHKSHLIVMSDAAVSPVDGVLTYDFTTQQSYINDPFFFGLVGQKEISTGVFAMYGGNADQSSTSSADVDITAGDDSIWNLNSPETRTYEVSDFNLDGEINAADRALFIINSPKTSSVPRN